VGSNPTPSAARSLVSSGNARSELSWAVSWCLTGSGRRSRVGGVSGGRSTRPRHLLIRRDVSVRGRRLSERGGSCRSGHLGATVSGVLGSRWGHRVAALASYPKVQVGVAGVEPSTSSSRSRSGDLRNLQVLEFALVRVWVIGAFECKIVSQISPKG
jgi:hypothetical protein